jgi:acetyl esterase
MATVVALMVKERQIRSLLSQLMSYLVTDASMSTRTYQEFAEGPGLARKAMAWFWDQNMPNADARRGIHASPINASLAELEGLPPTLVWSASTTSCATRAKLTDGS